MNRAVVLLALLAGACRTPPREPPPTKIDPAHRDETEHEALPGQVRLGAAFDVYVGDTGVGKLPSKDTGDAVAAGIRQELIDLFDAGVILTKGGPQA